MRAWLATTGLMLLVSVSWAQLVTVPIPGAPGLSITVATGASAQPLRMISSSPNAVNVTMADDANVPVPLQFVFPYWTQQFTQSWMHSNGVVSFQSPAITGNFCCRGINLATTTNPALNYAIMPLWTDLIATTLGSHWYLSRPNDMTYAWYNVNQYNTNNTSSFELRIDRQGLVDVRLQGALVTSALVTSGMTGNLAQGQYYQYYHGSGFSAQILQWSALDGTTTAADPCAVNPLSSPTCANYASAYLTQQCTISALYDPTCPGYAQANFTYQCSINPLYSELCAGYAQAYYNQQCSLNPLYDSGCTGYQQAYATQQLLSQNTSINTTEPTTINDPIDTVQSISAAAAPSASPAAVTTAVPLIPAGPGTGALSVQSLASQANAPAASTAAVAQPQTRAQQLQQARMAAQRLLTLARGAQAQKDSQAATTLEEQVAAQNSVITVMGHNAAFGTYENIVLRDVQFYRPREIYPNQVTVDNQRARRGLTGASDRRHSELIDQQYQ